MKEKNNLKEKFYVDNPFPKSELGFENTNPSLDLSIIVPIYNTKKYLKECIESLLMQDTSFTYEILLIDDGSTDDSLNYARKNYSNNNLIKIFHKDNGGLSSARNYGLRHSNGKYITFVDSDDYLSKNYVEIMMKKIYDEKADIVKCGYYEFRNSDGKIIKRVKYHNRVMNNDDLYLFKVKGHGCMCIINRKLFEQVRFPLNYLYEDMIIRFLIYPQCNKICSISDSLYYYRINNNSLSRSITNKVNYKSLSQYFLLVDILKFRDKFGYKNNTLNVKFLINELTTTMYLRIRHLDKNTFKDVFEASCELIKNLNINYKIYKINLLERMKVYSLYNKNIVMWKLLSFYSLILIKIK